MRRCVFFAFLLFVHLALACPVMCAESIVVPESMVESVGRIESLLFVMLTVQCFGAGLLLWRLVVLSSSRRNLL